VAGVADLVDVVDLVDQEPVAELRVFTVASKTAFARYASSSSASVTGRASQA
jgi:hypothetical protein